MTRRRKRMGKARHFVEGVTDIVSPGAARRMSEFRETKRPFDAEAGRPAAGAARADKATGSGSG